MKTYKISDKLMNLLVDYFLYDRITEATHQAIVKELDAKIDAMVRRANYSESLGKTNRSDKPVL